MMICYCKNDTPQPTTHTMTATVANKEEEESNHTAGAAAVLNSSSNSSSNNNSTNESSGIMIPKGTVIYEWTDPYLVVPLYDVSLQRRRRRRRQNCTTTTNNNNNNKDDNNAMKTRMTNKKRKRPFEASLSKEEEEEELAVDGGSDIDTLCQQFPRWKGCHHDVSDHHHHHHHNPTNRKNKDQAGEEYSWMTMTMMMQNNPQLQAFVRNLTSKVLSTEDDDGGDEDGDNNSTTIDTTARSTNGIDNLIYRELAIMALLRVIEMKLNFEDGETNTALATRQLDFSDQRLAHEATSTSTDDCHANDDVLLIELWPLIQTHLSWDDCRYLFGAIKTKLHVLPLPHPLKLYAQETVFRLDQEEFDELWTIIIQHHHRHNPHHAPPRDGRVNGNDRRHYACQLLLDKVAAVPTRWVGVLLEDPTIKTDKIRASIVCPSPSTSNIDISDIRQSCLPEMCLEVSISDISRDSDTRKTMLCSLIALYDLDLTDKSRKSNHLTITSQPKRKDCACFRCTYETRKDDASFSITSEDISLFLQLAHYKFQNQIFDEASELYRQCYDMIRTSTKEKADCAHSMAAVLLSQNKFAEAQRLWKNHENFASLHNEISVQCDKQTAYQYFQPLDESSIQSVDIPSYDLIEPLIPSRFNPSSAKSKSIFLAKTVMEPSVCNQLIEWAQDYAQTSNGWTTSRHYAVPTTDIPVHEVPSLLQWFQGFMDKTLFPLLHDQFSVSRTDKCNRFYVHDAFLVRYEGSRSNNFLPLHYDESTHSCVIALNDCSDVNYETNGQLSSYAPTYSGGGTFFYDLKRSFSPPKGGMVSFCGDQCLHGGNPVIEGTRYIIAIFLYLDEDLAAPVRIVKDCDSPKKKAFEFSFF